MSYVVAVSENLSEGFDVVGPFATWDDAVEWIDGYPKEVECQITHLLDPKEIDG